MPVTTFKVDTAYVPVVLQAAIKFKNGRRQELGKEVHLISQPWDMLTKEMALATAAL